MAQTNAIVTLYRVVSPEEAHDIRSSGGLRLGSGSAYVEGKRFARSFSDAVRWGQRMPPVSARRPFIVAEAQVPSHLVETSLRFDRLDGVGPAVFVRLDALRPMNPAGAISLIEVDREEPPR